MHSRYKIHLANGDSPHAAKRIRASKTLTIYARIDTRRSCSYRMTRLRSQQMIRQVYTPARIRRGDLLSDPATRTRLQASRLQRTSNYALITRHSCSDGGNRTKNRVAASDSTSPLADGRKGSAKSNECLLAATGPCAWLYECGVTNASTTMGHDEPELTMSSADAHSPTPSPTAGSMRSRSDQMVAANTADSYAYDR